jgi:hypothetical protein
MKEYRVNWDEPPYVERKISAGSYEEAYEQFLKSEKKLPPVQVVVKGGLGGHKIFKHHIGEEDLKAQEQERQAQEEERQAQEQQRQAQEEAERKAKEAERQAQEEAERKAKEAKEAERKAKEEWKRRAAIAQGIVDTLKSGGFISLNHQEIPLVAEVVGVALRQPSDLVSEELALVEAALSDSATYRYLTMRNSSLAMENQEVIAKNQEVMAKNQEVMAKTQEVMAKNLSAMAKSLGAKLSDISHKAGGIKAGATFAGLAAARHLGEELAEDFGGDE